MTGIYGWSIPLDHLAGQYWSEYEAMPYSTGSPIIALFYLQDKARPVSLILQ